MHRSAISVPWPTPRPARAYRSAIRNGGPSGQCRAASNASCWAWISAIVLLEGSALLIKDGAVARVATPTQVGPLHHEITVGHRSLSRCTRRAAAWLRPSSFTICRRETAAHGHAAAEAALPATRAQRSCVPRKPRPPGAARGETPGRAAWVPGRKVVSQSPRGTTTLRAAIPRDPAQRPRRLHADVRVALPIRGQDLLVRHQRPVPSHQIRRGRPAAYRGAIFRGGDPGVTRDAS
jgi:hypothetical protein